LSTKITQKERISDYGIDAIARIEDWCNNLPRKILGYKIPDELFEAKLDEIYSA
jgi:IS30 family transposase